MAEKGVKWVIENLETRASVLLFHRGRPHRCLLMAGLAGPEEWGEVLYIVPGGTAGHTGSDVHVHALGWWMKQGGGMRGWPEASAFSLL